MSLSSFSPAYFTINKYWIKVLNYFKSGLRWPGVEPGSTAWKAAMLTVIPPSHLCLIEYLPAFLIYCVRMLGFKNDGNMFHRKISWKMLLPDGELNPGLPRDRRGYSPLYYRGLVNTCIILYQFKHCKVVVLYLVLTNARPTFWYVSTGPLETFF